MMDDRLDDDIQKLAREYHQPPDTPREEMWARIVAAREARRQEKRMVVLRPWMRWSAAAAAMLAVGIGIGRWTIAHDRPASDDTALAPASDVAYHVAAAQYLTRTETLLTDFRAEARGGKPDRQFASQARDLLATTRLMLNSPAAKDQRLKSLLEDLEVMLAQIAQLPADRSGDDVEFINQGLDQRSVLLRLRAATPVPGMSARGVL